MLPVFPGSCFLCAFVSPFVFPFFSALQGPRRGTAVNGARLPPTDRFLCVLISPLRVGRNSACSPLPFIVRSDGLGRSTACGKDREWVQRFRNTVAV